MGKTTSENDLKGWENEIDSAVDRLFVDGKEGSGGPPYLEPSLPPPHPSFHLLRAIEVVEAQLLALEWEITQENLEKAKKDFADLRGIFKEKPEILSVIHFIEEVLNQMGTHESNIRPPQIHFLMDAMQTIKLLMKGEKDGEINTYKKLAYAGIEARFSYLERMRETFSQPLALSLFEKTPVKETPEKGMNMTIFKVGGKWFGVESDKVFKLFKVPRTLYDRFSNAQIIRLRETEVRWIDLKTLFSIPEREEKGERNILTVKDNGGYKGWMVAQGIKRVSCRSEVQEGMGEYFSGVIHWTEQEQLTEIPILNLKSLNNFAGIKKTIGG